MTTSGVQSAVAQAGAADDHVILQKSLDKMAGDWHNLPEGHKLKKFHAKLGDILSSTGYNEMYGVELHPPAEGKSPSHSTLIILQKFLRANVDDLEKAKEQLTASLKWRKDYQPLKARDEAFDGEKFGKLGYITRVKGVKGSKNAEDVATFNIYGAAAKDFKKTFGDTDAFLRWRVAQMELTLKELDLNAADQTIPDYGKGPDPYKAIAVHDYLSVSFFRQPSEIKTASTKIIDMFQRYYPETVGQKFFVNVPLVMQWMMGAMKALLSKDSIQSMTWMTNGSQLKDYLGADIPKEYGGTGAPLAETAITPKYGKEEAQKDTPAPVVAPVVAPVATTASTDPPAEEKKAEEKKVEEKKVEEKVEEKKVEEKEVEEEKKVEEKEVEEKKVEENKAEEKVEEKEVEEKKAEDKVEEKEIEEKKAEDKVEEKEVEEKKAEEKKVEEKKVEEPLAEPAAPATAIAEPATAEPTPAAVVPEAATENAGTTVATANSSEVIDTPEEKKAA